MWRRKLIPGKIHKNYFCSYVENDWKFCFIIICFIINYSLILAGSENNFINASSLELPDKLG